MTLQSFSLAISVLAGMVCLYVAYRRTKNKPQPHNCIDHLIMTHCDSVDTHGLDCGPFERFSDVRYECPICGEVYTEQEAEAINA